MAGYAQELDILALGSSESSCQQVNEARSFVRWTQRERARTHACERFFLHFAANKPTRKTSPLFKSPELRTRKQTARDHPSEQHTWETVRHTGPKTRPPNPQAFNPKWSPFVLRIFSHDFGIIVPRSLPRSMSSISRQWQPVCYSSLCTNRIFTHIYITFCFQDVFKPNGTECLVELCMSSSLELKSYTEQPCRTGLFFCRRRKMKTEKSDA